MTQKLIVTAVCSMLVGGCASTGSMSDTELVDCLQPNRRAVVEIVGLAAKPVPKPKPDAEPPAKPPKPEFEPVELNAMAQGNSAFDVGRAVLKDTGKEDVDELLASLKKQKIQVNAVIVSGHTDRLEERSGPKTLSEDRAKALKDYLVSKGFDEKMIFWEGKSARDPVPVTKFCQ